MQLPELFLDLFFPRRCVVCQQEGSWACQDCLQFAADGTEDFDRFELEPGLPAISLLPFELKLVRELLHHLKYNGIYEAADSFLKLLKLTHSKDELREQIGCTNPILVPVPTSRERFRQRGYNQAFLLATAIGEWLNIPVDDSLLVRTSGHSQVGKTALQRAETLSGSFIWKGDELLTRHAVLFDDLCTTGSTLRACADSLRPHLSAGVSVLTLARKH